MEQEKDVINNTKINEPISENDDKKNHTFWKNFKIALKGWWQDRKLVFLFSVIVLGILAFQTFYTQELDRILNYEITVVPDEATTDLTITYDITWKVLNSYVEGPFTWAKIGLPTSSLKGDLIPLSNNIRKISRYDTHYVRIDLDKAYYKNDVVRFRYQIVCNGAFLAEELNDKVYYPFTAAWFDAARVDHFQVNWLAKNVQEWYSNTPFQIQGKYLILEKNNLKVGEQVPFVIAYAKSSFARVIALSSHRESYYTTYYANSYQDMHLFDYLEIILYSIIFFFYMIFDFIASLFHDYSYNRRFGHTARRGTWVHHTRPTSGGHGGGGCACACACAGSGRAGCSKKDFYGTNLQYQKKSKHS